MYKYISKYLRPLENADDNNGFYLNNICQRKANEKRKKKLREKGSKKIDFIDSFFFPLSIQNGITRIVSSKKKLLRFYSKNKSSMYSMSRWHLQKHTNIVIYQTR